MIEHCITKMENLKTAFLYGAYQPFYLTLPVLPRTISLAGTMIFNPISLPEAMCSSRIRTASSPKSSM